jgi:hypothetical protein
VRSDNATLADGDVPCSSLLWRRLLLGLRLRLLLFSMVDGEVSRRRFRERVAVGDSGGVGRRFGDAAFVGSGESRSQDSIRSVEEMCELNKEEREEVSGEREEDSMARRRHEGCGVVLSSNDARLTSRHLGTL